MKIFFYSSGNQNFGSNRIYINNLSHWLNQLNIDCIVSKDLNKSIDADICILNKFSLLPEIKFVKQLNKNCKIGTYTSIRFTIRF